MTSRPWGSDPWVAPEGRVCPGAQGLSQALSPLHSCMSSQGSEGQAWSCGESLSGHFTQASPPPAGPGPGVRVVS